MGNFIAILFFGGIVSIFFRHLRNEKKNHRLGKGISSSSSAEYAGKIGESAVSSVLTGYCRRSNAHFFDNVTLPVDDGTTQIDHILVTKKGVLVIETKNWSGYIYGKAEDATWTQVLSSGKNVYQNPIRQNYKHYLAICSLLDFLPQYCIQEIVVFTGKAIFKTDIPDGVVFIDELEDVLEFIDFGNLSDDDIHRSVGRIECNRFERSHQTDRIHQEYLKRNFGNSPIHINGEYIRRRNYRCRK
jgi:hypothetical protein